MWRRWWRRVEFWWSQLHKTPLDAFFTLNWPGFLFISSRWDFCNEQLFPLLTSMVFTWWSSWSSCHHCCHNAGSMQLDAVYYWTTTSWWQICYYFSSLFFYQLSFFFTKRWQVMQMCFHFNLEFSNHWTGTWSILASRWNVNMMATLLGWSFNNQHICILARAHIAWVYSYGLSLATGFTFAITLVSQWSPTIANVAVFIQFLPINIYHPGHQHHLYSCLGQIGMRAREWKNVIKGATKQTNSFHFEKPTTSRKRQGGDLENMETDVAWLEKRLNLRSAEQK